MAYRSVAHLPRPLSAMLLACTSVHRKVCPTDTIDGELGNLTGGLVLTENYNPISHQREHATLIWRQAMRNYLGEENLKWLLF